MAGTNVGSVYFDLKLNIDELESGFLQASEMLEGLKGDFGVFGGSLQEVFSDNLKLQDRMAEVLGRISERAAGFGAAALGLGENLRTVPLETFNAGITRLQGGITNLTQGAKEFGERFRTAFANARIEARELDEGVASTGVSILDSWTNMLEGLGGGWDNIWLGIKRSFNNVINAIIDGFNVMISGINRIQLDIPRWLGGGSLGFNIPLMPNIPQLAKGGIVSAPTLALVGERGKEAVLPLENNTGWMVGLANMIADAVTAGSGAKPASSPQKIVVELDGKKLAEALVDDLAEVNERLGYIVA